jgi:phosphate:Na+ symporter
MDYVGIAIKFLGSFGLFIFGITLLSAGLQKTAGSRMKHILGNVSKSRFSGVLFGAGVTAIIQSSTATTVMAVGFVNAGIIALPQIVGIIMGANVGTTVTAWLVSSVEWSHLLKPDTIGAICAATGALMLLFSKDKKRKNIGEVIVGFGVLFLGLSMMPEAAKPLAELDVVRQLFMTMGTNPILGIIVGILVTAIIQSSTASIGILQSMAFAGMVPWNAAVYIILGQNIGTCVTAVISSIGASKNARAAANIHLVYNLIGAAVFCILAIVYFAFLNPVLGAASITATNISMVHTGYNVAALFLLFPFGQLIMKLSAKMAGIGKPGATGDASDLPELDDNILETPSYALENSSKAILKLMGMMRENLELSVNSILQRDFKKVADFRSKADDINKASGKINEFLTKLYHEKLSNEEKTMVAAFIHTIISLKRISNRARGFAALAEDMQDSGMKEQYVGINMLTEIYEKTMLCYDSMVDAFKAKDTGSVNLTIVYADNVEMMREEFKAGHIKLASHTDYAVETGIMYSEAARHLARIAHNMKSVVEAIPLTEEDKLEDIFARR